MQVGYAVVGDQACVYSVQLADAGCVWTVHRGCVRTEWLHVQRGVQLMYHAETDRANAGDIGHRGRQGERTA